MSNKRRYFFISISLLILSSCLGRETQTGSAVQSSLNNGGDGSVGSVLFTAAPAKQVVNLGTEVSFPMSITSVAGFSGIVSLKSDLSSLRTLDAALNPFLKSVVVRFKGANDVRAMEQLDVALSPGQSMNVTVTIETDSRAPDYDSLFRVQTVNAAGKVLDSKDVMFQIKNVYEMRLFGGPVANTTPSRWSNAKEAYLRSHALGVSLLFVNYDSSRNHIIHSGNNTLFPHEQGTGMAAALNSTTPNPNGGSYLNMNASTQANLSGSYYLHNEDDNSGLAAAVYTRSITLNSSTMVPTFAKIKTEILDRKCNSCHGAGSANGSLITAADVRNMIANRFANNAQAMIDTFTGASAYNMPPGGPGLTVDEQHYLSDYIRSGAPN